MIPHGLIRSALRRVWQFYSLARRDAKKAARVLPGRYQCAECKFLFRDKEIDVDHIVPCGPTPGSRNAKNGETWDQFIARLFCEKDGLRILCKGCHAKRGAA